MYRIKKIETLKSTKYFPQVKGLFGWSNVYYDFYFERLDTAKDFLDEYTDPYKEKIEYINYNNPKAIKKKDLYGGFLRLFLGD